MNLRQTILYPDFTVLNIFCAFAYYLSAQGKRTFFRDIVILYQNINRVSFKY